MQILVVNDDGIESLGIWALAAALRHAGLGEVLIVALEVEQSGTSMALGLRQALSLRRVAAPAPAYAGIAAYALRGTPVGCVLAGMRAGLAPPPDVIVTGINLGLNSGTNILLSGTVGAAMMGALWGLPAMAVSQMFTGEGAMPWGTATWAAVKAFPLLERLRGHGPVVLNVNVPYLHEIGEVRGFRQTSISDFFYGSIVELAVDPSPDAEGRHPVALRYVRERVPAFDETTDDGAVRAGYVSLTPLVPMGAAPLDLRVALADL